MRSCSLTDNDVSQMCQALKSNSTIKVIDFSSNRDLGKATIDSIIDAIQVNRTLEYLGLSKLNLTTEMVIPLFDMIGRFPFPEDQVEN